MTKPHQIYLVIPYNTWQYRCFQNTKAPLGPCTSVILTIKVQQNGAWYWPGVTQWFPLPRITRTVPKRELTISFPHKLNAPYLQLKKKNSIPYTHTHKALKSITVDNYSLKWRWMVVDICRAAKRPGKCPPLFTDTEVNICFSIFYTSWIHSAKHYHICNN